MGVDLTKCYLRPCWPLSGLSTSRMPRYIVFFTFRTLPHLCTTAASNLVSLDRTKIYGSTSSEAPALRPCHSSGNGMILLVCSAMGRTFPSWRFLRRHTPCYSGPRIEKDAKLHLDGLYSFESMQMKSVYQPSPTFPVICSRN